MEFGGTPKRRPTPLEARVIDCFSMSKLSSFDVALELDLDLAFINQTTTRWLMNKYEYTAKPHKLKKETTMANNKDKNKQERDKTLAELREGKAAYGVEMDKVRGLLGELEGGEALICQRQASTSKVILRLGDVSYL
jgi:hypothetical protein